MNVEGAKNYINMLESLLEIADNDNDTAFLEGALNGFMSILEGTMFVEFAPIMGKVLPARYIPSDADTEEVISKSGKKSYKTKIPTPSSEDVVRDTIMWIYSSLASRDKDTINDDFVKMILFNPNPEVTATGFENQSIKPVTGNLSTHPLWDAIKNEMSSILTTSDDPYFKSLRQRMETKMFNDEKSYHNIKKTKNVDMGSIERINQMTDTYKSARKTGHIDDIAAQKEAQRKADADAAMKATQASAEKRIAAEQERKAKLADISLADIAAKFDADANKPKASLDDMKAKMAAEEERKAELRKKWDLMFAS